MENLKVVKAEGLRLWQHTYSLNRKARRESWGLFRPLNSHDFTVYMLYKGEKPVGYAAWNLWKDGKPVLRQLYITPEERRRGYGCFLLQESWRLFKAGEAFLVESPSHATLNMLVKLGYAKREGEACVGEKVMFVG
jgi:hypothetical protein